MTKNFKNIISQVLDFSIQNLLGQVDKKLQIEMKTYFRKD
mgnify:CR=1 FL=1